MLRWRKNPRPSGLAAVCSSPRGSTLYKDKTLRCATTASARDGGWYWVAGWESDVPRLNTCNSPVKTEEEAKKDARKYVVKHLTE